MNYTSLVALAVLLLAAAPFLLLGAHREGKRRRGRAAQGRRGDGGRTP